VPDLVERFAVAVAFLRVLRRTPAPPQTKVSVSMSRLCVSSQSIKRRPAASPARIAPRYSTGFSMPLPVNTRVGQVHLHPLARVLRVHSHARIFVVRRRGLPHQFARAGRVCKTLSCSTAHMQSTRWHNDASRSNAGDAKPGRDAGRGRATV
jgi:hypothetical protein